MKNFFHFPGKSIASARRGFAFWFPAGLSLGVGVLALTPLLLLPLAQVRSAPASRALVRTIPFDENAAHYSILEATGQIEELQARLKRGDTQLKHDSVQGYLPAVLNALSISPDSQILVFSKTSAQREHISPQTPRAIYFNDEVAVAWTPGAPELEIAAADPRIGVVFYTLDQATARAAHPIRNDRCLECHTSAKNLAVPGFIARSVITDPRGVASLREGGASYVTHRTPLSQRWGGWYVCGVHGDQVHLGNLAGPADLQRQAEEPNFKGNLTDLGQLFDINAYPARTSDMVALLVFEHQCHMRNLITRLRRDASLLSEEGEDSRETRARFTGLVESFVKYLLFAEEAPLAAPVRGVSGFSSHFEKQGPRDPSGRSLRQFDLQKRLFKYPCSYLIYSKEFDSLPREAKLRVYRRLWEVLSGEDRDPAYGKLSNEDRQAIREILMTTKTDLPVYWSL